MAIGSIINLGGGGGSISGAKGVIICDTSTMTVGDTIRVRDVYDSQNVQNKQVVTVGTPVIFEVEPYCYYKICMVQTIDDTPTEIGGVYKTVDLGQTIFIDVLNKTTLGGIQGILNAHQEGNLLAVGDEVDITVNGNPVTFLVGAVNLYDTHECLFVSKNVYSLSTTAEDYSNSVLRSTAQSFYANIDNKDKQYIKQVSRRSLSSGGAVTYNDYVWVAGMREVFDGYAQYIGEQKQFPIYVAQANRIKTYNGTGNAWWTSDWWTGSQMKYVTSTGGDTYGDKTNQYGFVPCFILRADS